MTIRLFVAEKPSVARDLAKALGAHRRADARLEGDGVWVTWCLGHLVELADPGTQDPAWKRWNPAALPMLPRQLKLRPIKRTAGHFRKVRAMLRDARVTEVINACDAGREGELIFRYVYELAGCKKPTRRFWVSSLTPSAIQKGLAHLRPGATMDPLNAAARCRAEADWLVGMNATRGLTSRADSLLSVGRVQTPTLAMVVERELAIERFVPERYWEVFAGLEARSGGWRARWIGSVGAAKSEHPGRLSAADDAHALAAHLRDGEGRVTVADRTRQTVLPPPLHHLTSLQQEANRRYGLTADQTLKTAQALYERHKLLTYPRTDARHLTADVAAGVPALLDALSGPYGALVEGIRAAGVPRLGKRYVDDAKVGDHHALLPTRTTPNLGALNRAERQIYDLVARRLLAALSPPAIYAKTRLEAEVKGERLEARGRMCIEPGWELADPPRRAPAKPGAKAPVELPLVHVGDPVRVADAKPVEKDTKPPRRYDEAGLLGAMEHAGRTLDEAALRAAMRGSGLGTPATRAATIETLLRRNYLDRAQKHLVPTVAGRALVAALSVDDLKSPRLTGEWEQRLTAIAEGREEAMPFRRDIRAFVRATVASLLAGPPIHLPAEMKSARRGAGGRGAKGRARAKSPRSPSTRSPSTRSPSTRSPSTRSARTSTRRTSTQPSRPKATPKTGLGACPACREGRIIRGQRGWGCDRWQHGCRFVVWFEIDGITVPDDEAARLFSKGQTRLFAKVPGHSRQCRLVVDASGARWQARAARQSPSAKS